MPKRSESRDNAKAEYIRRKTAGEKVNLRELAEKFGVSYQTLRNWKSEDKWEKELPKRKRGGQPGNKNSAGHKNAKGSHKGAPPRNKNAEKDGAYSTVFFDTLSDKDKEIAEKAPIKSKEALKNEMQILKVREHRILEKIADYEKADQEQLFLNNVMDVRTPENGEDGKNQTNGMYFKDTAFARTMKLEEALYKVQGRIAKIADSLKDLELANSRNDMEQKKLDILRMRATGAVDIGDLNIEDTGDVNGQQAEETK